ncbi:IS66 family insertion sequence hypothetical protein [Oleomonas cavernae]|uniref:Transposase n=1 Tax=Oleomonas cavernae TaxID=2320859 RepID=A0A418W8Y9_9PROT|nr:transposase [Oleomonas cavernae]RJF86458.1 IS66 family insertion sequence hypothetical protein [Oleomonas cavernae]RJF86473.1 IS66 family insertion sequence hypothetical protein [Oleomonas cavernae]
MRQDILTGPERRRRWAIAEKRRIVDEAGAEGVSVAEVARRHDLTRQHIYQWRRELQAKGDLPTVATVFLPVEISSDDGRTERGGDADLVHGYQVEIVVRNGRSVRVASDVPDVIVQRMIRLAEAP